MLVRLQIDVRVCVSLHVCVCVCVSPPAFPAGATRIAEWVVGRPFVLRGIGVTSLGALPGTSRGALPSACRRQGYPRGGGLLTGLRRSTLTI